MEAWEHKLEKYAELAVRVGINIQPGQNLFIQSPIEAAEFVRKAAVKAYEAGAKQVYVDWEDDELKALKLKHAPAEAFAEYPLWKARGMEEMAAAGTAFLQVYAPNADLLKNANPEHVAAMNKSTAAALKAWREYILSNRMSWVVVSVPTPGWSAKVFPEVDESERMDRLWEQIFSLTRVDTSDPVAAWQAHIQHLTQRKSLLNERKYTKLHLRATGTDLTVELPPRHEWVSAGLHNTQGTFFIPNLPTEEVFTMPHKFGVNGTVRSTKPLAYNGSLIDDFTLTFEKGKVVNATAAKGQESLLKLLDTDEGARYLGEIALVPHDSPVSNSNLIFYNTLLDENAACHLALGAALQFCLEGGTSMSQEELAENGFNQSLIHVDFMIGSADMEIDGQLADGSWEPVFRSGNWAK